MFSYKASVVEMCVLFSLYDRHCSHTKPHSPKNVSYLDSIIAIDRLESLGCSWMAKGEGDPQTSAEMKWGEGWGEDDVVPLVVRKEAANIKNEG